MELWSNEEGLMEELLGLREMDYYRNQDLMNRGDWHWNILEDFSFPTSTTSCFHDHFFQPPSDSSNTIIDSPTQTLPYSNSGFRDLDTGPPCKPASKPKKLPSKNLMAERRRRKRLNDRLSMLRSVVPKISKMDRTSILGDTIDYTKELLDSINKLQEEMKLGANELGLFTIFKNAKPQETFIRNSPKFEVERRNSETRIEICCGAKPGLLLSTVTTLEALGMDIDHCVISCFNDFQMQASCSHSQERAALDSEDIKQALFGNAGYGGRCL